MEDLVDAISLIIAKLKPRKLRETLDRLMLLNHYEMMAMSNFKGIVIRYKLEIIRSQFILSYDKRFNDYRKQ